MAQTFSLLMIMIAMDPGKAPELQARRMPENRRLG